MDKYKKIGLIGSGLTLLGCFFPWYTWQYNAQSHPVSFYMFQGMEGMILLPILIGVLILLLFKRSSPLQRKQSIALLGMIGFILLILSLSILGMWFNANKAAKLGLYLTFFGSLIIFYAGVVSIKQSK